MSAQSVSKVFRLACVLLVLACAPPTGGPGQLPSATLKLHVTPVPLPAGLVDHYSLVLESPGKKTVERTVTTLPDPLVFTDLAQGEWRLSIAGLAAQSPDPWSGLTLKLKLNKPLVEQTLVLAQTRATPVRFSLSDGPAAEGQTLEMTSDTAGAVIYYDINTTGTHPSLKYQGPLTLSGRGPTTIRAMAVKTGLRYTSSLSQVQLDLRSASELSPAPVFNETWNADRSQLTLVLSGVPVIHYTLDGSQPTAGSPVYSTPLVFGQPGTVVVRAFGKAGSQPDSATVNRQFTLSDATQTDPNLTTGGVTIQPETSQITVESWVTLASTSLGASIYYTIDGSDPKAAEALPRLYEAPFHLPSGPVTVRAYAVKAGLAPSATAQRSYSVQPLTQEGQAQPPLLQPVGPNLLTTDKLQFSSVHPGAVIKYTLDGKDPLTDGQIYTVPVSLPEGSITVTAITTLPDNSLKPSVPLVRIYTVTTPAVLTDTIKVYVKNYANLHYWAVTPALTPTTWPGVTLNPGVDGWNWFEFPKGTTSTKLVFNGPGQTADLILSTQGEWAWTGTAWTKWVKPAAAVPVIQFSLGTGTYLTAQTISLTSTSADDVVYWTLDGSSPAVYSSPLAIKATSTLTAWGVNRDGVAGEKVSRIYTINPDADLAAPELQASRTSGRFDLPFEVTFTLKDNKSATATAYYTTDGSTPNAQSPVYVSGDASQGLMGLKIGVGSTRVVRFYLVDSAGNAAYKSFNYVVGPGSTRKDFREESVYFLMTARFYDGDPANTTRSPADDQANDKYNDPSWRGDFKGLIEKLPYIKALGFTAIWITPPVLNRNYFDFHGYHGWDFTKIDGRLESPGATYQDLINAAHALDMKVMQDIVLNHSGRYGLKGKAEIKYWGDRDDPQWGKNSKINYYDEYNPDFVYDGITKEPKSGRSWYNGDLWQKQKPVFPWQPADEYYWWNGQTYSHAKDLDNLWGVKSPYSSPEGYSVWHFQWPGMYESQFSLLDPQWFHRFWLKNWEDYTVQLGTIHEDCLDLNTESPVVQDYLINAYGKYIQMGVDAFRIDTVKHISRNTFNRRFNTAFMNIAKAAGNPNFYMVGEVCARENGVWNKGIPPASVPFYTWREPDAAPYTLEQDDLKAAHLAWDYAVAQGPAGQPTSDNGFLAGPDGNDYHVPDYSRKADLNVIDFRMHWNFKTASSAFGVRDGDQYTNDPTWNMTYVESHDYSPWEVGNSLYARGSDATTMAENWSLMFTWRGIPSIYYGNETLFKGGKVIDGGPKLALEESGRAYFGGNISGDVTATGFGQYTGASGNLAASLQHPLAQHLIKLNRLRQAVPALQKGQYSTKNVTGSIAFKRRYTDTASNTDSFALVTVSGPATFTAIPNGRYVDLATGDVKTVTTGSLSISCTGAGNLRVYVLDNGKGLAPNVTAGQIGGLTQWIK